MFLEAGDSPRSSVGQMCGFGWGAGEGGGICLGGGRAGEWEWVGRAWGKWEEDSCIWMGVAIGTDQRVCLQAIYQYKVL